MTQRPIDLHVHSTKSDGTFTPAQLVTLAGQKGLAAFALTDHDTTDGIDEATAAAEGTGIEVVPGIEISTEYRKWDIHIVGLYIDYRQPDFQAAIHSFAGAREKRNRQMCEKLTAGGYPVSYADLTRAYPDTVITRAHFAQYMELHGIVPSMRDAFQNLIGDDGPYFVPRHKISPQDAVRLILRYDGIPILAHPLSYHMEWYELDDLILSLKRSGLMGIEAYYPTHTQYDTMQISEVAARYGLLLSGGSDFHGERKKNLELGTGYGNLFVPQSALLEMKKVLKRGT